jgi:hypothetical protein
VGAKEGFPGKLGYITHVEIEFSHFDENLHFQ